MRPRLAGTISLPSLVARERAQGWDLACGQKTRVRASPQVPRRSRLRRRGLPRSSSGIARLRNAFNAETMDGEQPTKPGIAGIYALPRRDRMGLHVVNHADAGLSHRRDIQDVEVWAAEHQAGQRRHGKFDHAVDAAVRSIADNAAADDL